MARRKVNINTLRLKKKRNEKITYLTAYDFPTAHFADQAEIDMLLIGDSGGMTMMGQESTISVTMDEMLMMAKSVVRGSKSTFNVGDMPFMSYQASNEDAIRNAGKLIAIGCDAVKLEGGTEVCERISAINNSGIPVMAHLGLTPQSLSQMGGYRVQGKNLSSFKKLLEDTLAVESAGAFSVLVEAIPEEVSAELYKHIKVPLYGIGAGKHVDGQLVISHDMLGLFVGDVNPKFVKKYANLSDSITNAFKEYKKDVENLSFPAEEHQYPIKEDDLKEIQKYSSSYKSK
ncbi:MAG: 3-methyl-2-oxobutanoate hydroxymethyltransferase [Chloroflexi bacterium]|nr:3-methyl-2-oxobutanoate hydroxymethyltransferase [Chloroflexota bacterium]|tara:strand:- start:879 stop:1742 length:864 start_codon:yes stop_codon:yes gene_type:complete